MNFDFSNICIDCIGDDQISALLSCGKCGFCGKEKEKCVKGEDLFDELTPLFRLYSPIHSYMLVAHLKEIDPLSYPDMTEVLQFTWGLFEGVDHEKLQSFLEEFSHPDDEFFQLFESSVGIEYDYYGINFELTENFNIEIWKGFCEEIKHSNRFFPKLLLDLSKFDELLLRLSSFCSKGQKFFRARLLINDHEKYPPEEMGKPPYEKVNSPGRANPVGISYLYLCSDQITTAYEIRAALLDRLTLGTFVSNEPLNLIDLTDMKFSPFIWKDDLYELYTHYALLKEFSFELSKPVENNSEEIDYLPSQYLCEYIKNKNYDGIKYESKRGKGINFVIFNDKKLICEETKLFIVEGNIKQI